MNPEYRTKLCAHLPSETVFPYFAEREGAWLLRHRMAEPVRIADLRRGPLAPLLDRPGVRDVVAACGRGWVAPENLLPLAEPIDAFEREDELSADRATRIAFDTAVAAEWRDFTVTYSGWADGCDGPARRDLQVSRPGGNLVVQVNFPASYQAAFEVLFGDDLRYMLDCAHHPVRSDLITMGWVRLDFDEQGEDLLIEEVQTDWLRAIARCRTHLVKHGSSMFKADREAFVDNTLETYGRDWARVLILAALDFARRKGGVRRVFMHQHLPGAKLKNIRDDLPPRSLYTDLPRRFGFARTDRAPEFLYRARSQMLARLRRRGVPLFWRLDLDATG